MSEVVDIDTTGLNRRIEELHDALQGQGGDASGIFRDESRLFLRQIIRLTPPKTKQQGESRIGRDLLKIFTPVQQDFVDDVVIEHGHNNIDEWITTADGSRKHLQWDYISNTGEEMYDYHQHNRDSRGRTVKRKRMSSTWYSPFVVSFEDFAKYRDRIRKRVGLRKSAWALSLVGLGGKVAGWIGKHVQSGKARGELHLTIGDHPSVLMTNRAAGIGGDLRIVRSALRIREAAIVKRIKLVVSGYSRDVAQGIKVARHFQPAPESFQEAA